MGLIAHPLAESSLDFLPIGMVNSCQSCGEEYTQQEEKPKDSLERMCAPEKSILFPKALFLFRFFVFFSIQQITPPARIIPAVRLTFHTMSDIKGFLSRFTLYPDKCARIIRIYLADWCPAFVSESVANTEMNSPSAAEFLLQSA